MGFLDEFGTELVIARCNVIPFANYCSVFYAFDQVYYFKLSNETKLSSEEVAGRHSIEKIKTRIREKVREVTGKEISSFVINRYCVSYMVICYSKEEAK